MTCADARKSMRTITKIFIAAAVALFALPQASLAKSKTLDAFVSKVSASLVSFDYSFTMPTKKARMTGNGSVKVQGTSFIVDGNGLEIWCDAGLSIGFRKRPWSSQSMIRTTAMRQTLPL